MTNPTLQESLPFLKSVSYCYGLSTDQDSNYQDNRAAHALRCLTAEAAKAGFELKIASGYRDFPRQLAIFNAKARGHRAVLNDSGDAIDRDGLSDKNWLYAILRFSALPGTSRHHWGTDFDVYDGLGLSDGQLLQLVPQESEPGGPFYEFHRWLDSRIENDQAFGFYRPYDRDRGGVACEPWHISHRPSAEAFRAQFDIEHLRAIYKESDIELRSVILENLEAILTRFVV